MSIRKSFVAGAALALALSFGSAQAGLDLNEVGAFWSIRRRGHLGWHQRRDVPDHHQHVEPEHHRHVSFINGDEWSSRYCYECDFDVPMSGLDTETLVLTRDGNVTHIVNLDTGASRSCSQKVGFVTVDVEDADHNVLTDNILLGSEVVVDYAQGTAMSVSAISIQGESGDGDRTFAFDGSEYRKFPSVVGADFLAPDYDGGLDAALVLFTLAFDRQFPR